jgi:hypothetical protein
MSAMRVSGFLAVCLAGCGPLRLQNGAGELGNVFARRDFQRLIEILVGAKQLLNILTEQELRDTMGFQPRRGQRLEHTSRLLQDFRAAGK